MPKETAAHKKYMKRYHEERRQERLASSPGALAEPAGDSRVDWVKFYRDLYSRLDAQDRQRKEEAKGEQYTEVHLSLYLPSAIAELEESDG